MLFPKPGKGTWFPYNNPRGQWQSLNHSVLLPKPCQGHSFIFLPSKWLHFGLLIKAVTFALVNTAVGAGWSHGLQQVALHGALAFRWKCAEVFSVPGSTQPNRSGMTSFFRRTRGRRQTVPLTSTKRFHQKNRRETHTQICKAMEQSEPLSVSLESTAPRQEKR